MIARHWPTIGRRGLPEKGETINPVGPRCHREIFWGAVFFFTLWC